MKYICLIFALLAVTAFVGCEEIQIGGGEDSRPVITPNYPPPVRPCPDGRCPVAKPDGSTYYNYVEVPVVNIPHELRKWNYKGGSCVHASAGSGFEWQGRGDWAKYWRENYSGGESYHGLTSKFDSHGIKYAATNSGDVQFLEDCCRLRYGAIIFFYPNHSIFLSHFDHEKAVVLDNNRIDEYITIPREEFVRAWRGYGGVAITPMVGAPAPPLLMAAID